MAFKGQSEGFYSLRAVIIVAALLVQTVQASNTTCVSDELDWYTSVVGESPCRTYERLRQICNNEYKVPSLSSTPPGDQCNDQLSTCCCNTIAYRLSMLCMVCQQDTQNSGSSGINAPLGTYGVYLKGCGPITNDSLPSNIQTAVCSENIRIDSFLYELEWSGGNWVYTFARETAETDHATHNNNTFTRCQNDVISLSPTSSSSLPTSTAEPPSTTSISGISPTSTTLSSEKSKSKSDAPALIGGLLGCLLFVAVSVLAVVIWRRRRTTRQGLEGESNIHEPSTVSLAPLNSAAANPLIPNRLVAEGTIAPPVSYGTSNPSQYPATSIEPSFRHNDGGPFMSTLTHPDASGLPPAYDPSWDSERDRSRQIRLSAGSVSMPPSNFANSEFSDDKP